jgi:hypothetical protein
MGGPRFEPEYCYPCETVGLMFYGGIVTHVRLLGWDILGALLPVSDCWAGVLRGHCCSYNTLQPMKYHWYSSFRLVLASLASVLALVKQHLLLHLHLYRHRLCSEHLSNQPTLNSPWCWCRCWCRCWGQCWGQCLIVGCQIPLDGLVYVEAIVY